MDSSPWLRCLNSRCISDGDGGMRLNWNVNFPAVGKKLSSLRQQALYNMMVYDLQWLDAYIKDLSGFLVDGLVLGCVVKDSGAGIELTPGVVSHAGRIVPLGGNYELNVGEGQYLCYENGLKALDSPSGIVIAQKLSGVYDYSCREFNRPAAVSGIAVVKSLDDTKYINADYVFVIDTCELYVRGSGSTAESSVLSSSGYMKFFSSGGFPLVTTTISNPNKITGIKQLTGITEIKSTVPFKLRLLVNGRLFGETAFAGSADYMRCSVSSPAELEEGKNIVQFVFVSNYESTVEAKASALLGG